MGVRLSKLFGIDIYTVDGEYKGKVFDLIINLEKGRIETITTEPLKPRTKQDAKRILSEKSIPYKKVKSAKDIIVIDNAIKVEERDEQAETTHSRPSAYATHYRRSKVAADQLRYKY
ncbi:MAG: PRC-barrel domain-containing protein [Candidatus Diapherotrites archaeon]|nr:PRC-barrel domain-containing protein [Candidatus Diapherotrites archaeon]